MNEIQNIPKIMVTSDYSIFKILDGNRSVQDGRVEKIKSSIKKVGYIPTPIVVNEKMQIIDGQGRFAALKEMEYPICYIVVPGLSIEHCIAMNINQTNWKIMDYVESHAKQGNENYIRLLNLFNKHPGIPFLPIAAIAAGNAVYAGSDLIKNGKFVVTEKRTAEADNILKWLEENILCMKGKIKGRFDYLLLAVSFCIEHIDVDKKRLATVLQENAYDIMPLASVAFTMKEIERIYNKRLSAKKIYFSTEYDMFMTKNVSGYQGHWGSKRK